MHFHYWFSGQQTVSWSCGMSTSHTVCAPSRVTSMKRTLLVWLPMETMLPVVRSQCRAFTQSLEWGYLNRQCYNCSPTSSVSFITPNILLLNCKQLPLIFVVCATSMSNTQRLQWRWIFFVNTQCCCVITELMSQHWFDICSLVQVSVPCLFIIFLSSLVSVRLLLHLYRQWKQLPVPVLQGTLQDTAHIQVWHGEERPGQGQEGGRHQWVCERSVLESSAWWSEFTSSLFFVLVPLMREAVCFLINDSSLLQESNVLIAANSQGTIKVCVFNHAHF